MSAFAKAAITVLAALALLTPPAARAGTYDVHTCKTAAGSFPNHAWKLYATGDDFRARDCDLSDSDPQLLLQNTTVNQAYNASRGASLTFTAPTGATIAGFRWERRQRHFNPTDNHPAGFDAYLFSLAQLGGIALEGSGAYDPATMSRLSSHGAWNTPSVKGGSDVVATQASYSEAAGYRGDATELKVVIGCWNNPCSLMTDNTQGPGYISWGMIGATVTINDPVPPTLDRVFPTGVAAPGVVGGDEAVTIDATDNAGVKRVEVLDVTSGLPLLVGAKDLPCDYSYVTPCLNGVRDAQVPVNVPNGGKRTLRVRVVDVAGNVTEGGDFSADVGGPLNGSNATAAAKLTANFANNRAKADVGFGKRSRIRGRLTDATGAPIAGATVQVLDRELRTGTRYAQRLEVTTDPSGRFSVLPGPGAARAIRFEYRSRRFLATANAASTVELRVAAGSTLKISPERVRPRGTITITGRLKGTPLPRSGKVVDLQAYEGGKWRTFDTTRARKGARFASKYRFLRAGSGASFLIRARIRRDDSYPYYLGYSPRVRVRVR